MQENQFTTNYVLILCLSWEGGAHTPLLELMLRVKMACQTSHSLILRKANMQNNVVDVYMHVQLAQILKFCNFYITIRLKQTQKNRYILLQIYAQLAYKYFYGNYCCFNKQDVLSSPSRFPVKYCSGKKQEIVDKLAMISQLIEFEVFVIISFFFFLLILQFLRKRVWM